MEFTGDYHMHSKYSDGRATVSEMVNSARLKGLRSVAITDHGPHNVGTGVEKASTFLDIKKELRELSDEYSDINIFCGCEADITGLNGEIDVPQEISKHLDVFIVGLHPFARPNHLADLWALNGRNQAARISQGARRKVTNSNTKTLVLAMENNSINIISHPGLGMPIDVAEVASACVRNNVYYEINCGHSFPPLEDVLEAKRQGVEFIVDSDAHFVESVGRLDYGSRILEQAQIAPEQVINTALGGKALPWEK